MRAGRSTPADLFDRAMRAKAARRRMLAALPFARKIEIVLAMNAASRALRGQIRRDRRR